MDQLAVLIRQTLEPDATVRRAGEKQITALQNDPSFGQIALNLAANASADRASRLGAAVSFKNWLKANWDEDSESTPINDPHRSSLKESVIGIHLSLGDVPNIQTQLDESIAIMAKSDFPDRWPTLVDQLLSNLSPTDFVKNNAVLSIAHSVFRTWRTEFRTNHLFTTINFVLERFAQPYLELFRQTDQVISSPNPPCPVPVLANTIYLLLELYYDFNAQDLPAFFEDNLNVFMELVHKYLTFSHPSLKQADDDDEEAEAGEEEKIKAIVCEIAEMYTQKYTEEFTMLGPFVETTWSMVTSLSSSKKYDTLVAKALGFLSVVVQMGSKKELFQDEKTLKNFCEKIVLPNMTLRSFEEELFEDDPMEYVRRDLESSLEVITRRHAATEFVRALMAQFEAQVTGIITHYVQAYLANYKADPTNNWKDKDTAIFLLTSVASRSFTARDGVTSTNALVDVISFFSEYILSDLQSPGSVHGIIQADAIKFLHTFRNQLTKEQLVQVLPLLVPHLKDARFVIVTYASITIERVLYVKQEGRLVMAPNDIAPYSQEILGALFFTIGKGGTPEQIAQNDHLMKCVMRVILTAKQGIVPVYGTVLESLVKILSEISKNPSNPKFNHYTFESISALVRFVVAADRSTLAEFERQLIPQFESILSQDVAEFMPFAFQIIAQLVELHAESELPQLYKALIQPILHGSLWQSRGNVPPLIRLMKAFLAKGSGDIFAPEQLNSIRDIIRYLYGIKAHDQHSWELVEALQQYVTSDKLTPIINDVYIVMLTRLMQTKTDMLTRGFIRELLFPIAIEKPGFKGDEIIGLLEGIQAGLFGQVMQSLIEEIPKANSRDRKIVTVGLSRLLTQTQRMVVGEGANLWVPLCRVLMKLLTTGQDLAKERKDEEVVDGVDLEDLSYQASYSKLGSSEGSKVDPLANITNVQKLFEDSFQAANQANPEKFTPLMNQVKS